MKNSNVNWLPNSAPDNNLNNTNEVTIWERLAQARRSPLDPTWLAEVYSPSLSSDLRIALCEKLGMLAERGWPLISQLIMTHGAQPEMVMAAGLCHQPVARDWLLGLLNRADRNDGDNLCVLQALSCWGADLSSDVVTSCLQNPAQQYRLTGLQLLSFRAHTLTDLELLTLCREALEDFRDPVTVAAIRVLQRRDGPEITRRLAELCRSGSMAVCEAAFRALGCIATAESQASLLELSQSLPDEQHRQLACKQLDQQFR